MREGSDDCDVHRAGVRAEIATVCRRCLGSRPTRRPHGPAGPQIPYSRSRARWRLLRDDRGSVTAELVVAVPLLLLMLMAIVQFAVWSHAVHIAQGASAQGLAVIRAQDGTVAAGTATAREVLDQLGTGPLVAAEVVSVREDGTARVTITGSASSVVPFLALPVRVESTGPIERFVVLGDVP